MYKMDRSHKDVYKVIQVKYVLYLTYFVAS